MPNFYRRLSSARSTSGPIADDGDDGIFIVGKNLSFKNNRLMTIDDADDKTTFPGLT
jgi:hypothetical protein